MFCLKMVEDLVEHLILDCGKLTLKILKKKKHLLLSLNRLLQNQSVRSVLGKI